MFRAIIMQRRRNVPDDQKLKMHVYANAHVQLQCSCGREFADRPLLQATSRSCAGTIMDRFSCKLQETL
jgi:hypothetical protein